MCNDDNRYIHINTDTHRLNTSRLLNDNQLLLLILLILLLFLALLILVPCSPKMLKALINKKMTCHAGRSRTWERRNTDVFSHCLKTDSTDDVRQKAVLHASHGGFKGTIIDIYL